METQGETAFRDLETAVLMETVGHALSVTERGRLQTRPTESIIALGGGALLREENRAFVESKGKVIFLAAKIDTLMERLGKDSNQRPLLAGDLESKLSALLEKRREHYNSFPLKIHVDGKTTEQNAHQAQIALGRHHLSAMGNTMCL